MPKALSDYGLRDWLRLRPLMHRIKTARYAVVDNLYLRRPARFGDVDAVAKALAGRSVLITVAFRDAEAIEWQYQLVRRFVPKALYVIADNTPDDGEAAAIAAVAAKFRIPYVRLPHNPWHQPSRSHGLALNWIWRNLLRPATPYAFGFLDDDLFPTAPDDPFAPLQSQSFYGVVRTAGARWFLWAGYCMFLFADVAHKPLDFRQDWFLGLDTGGGNWDVLYRHVERSRIRELSGWQEPYRPGASLEQAPIHWIGPWLHEVGSTGNRALDEDKRRVIAARLAPLLNEAGGPSRDGGANVQAHSS
jgi:hypothetical protein